MLLLGEIQTGLLNSATPLPRGTVQEFLALLPGQRVLSAERPVGLAVSPDLVTGVDCRLAAAGKVRPRGIGTVTSRAVVVGGMVLQTSARTELVPAGQESRLPWAHYAARPARVEVHGGASAEDLAAGFLQLPDPGPTLDLNSVAAYLRGQLQLRPQLTHDGPLRTRPTRVRWVARPPEGGEPSAVVTVRDETVREIVVRIDSADPVATQRFCEDLALHDWLLTTMAGVIESAERAQRSAREPVDVLGPALQLLQHLWLPGGHVAPRYRPLWQALEQRPGFSRQWESQVARIRDWVAVRTLEELRRLRTP